MILQFEREHTSIYFRFQLMYKGQRTGTITLNSSPIGHMDATGNFPSGNFRMTAGGAFGPIQWDEAGKANRKEAGQFQMNGQNGIIYNCGEKGSNFFNGIYWWEFQGAERVYKAYEVGFGGKGIYYCLWAENRLVGVISKVTHTAHFESYYTIYCTDEISVEWLAMINLYWDMTRHYLTRSSEEWHRLDTWQKEIKDKYDPAFIPKIITQEGCQLIHCRDCGGQIPSDVAFCPQCGSHTVEPAKPAVHKPPVAAVAAMIAGIFSVGASWCSIAGYIFALIALLAYFLGRKKNQGSHKAYQYLMIGRLCAFAGLILSTFWLVIWNA